MLTLFYAPNACSMAAHIVLEESGQKYEAKKMDLSKGEQKTPEYLKIHPLGRVPALRLDDGTPLSENTAILPFLGKRFGLWPLDPVSEAKASRRSASSPRACIPRTRTSAAPSATPRTNRRSRGCRRWARRASTTT